VLSWPQKKAIADISYSSLPKTKILEVGFGNAEVLDRLSLHTEYELVAGIEISEEAVKAARKRLGYRRNILLMNEEGSGLGNVPGYDIALAFEVIEHQKNPLEFLQRLPGHILYLSTPNVRRWYVEKFKDYEYWDWPPNHLWRFCDCPASTSARTYCSEACTCCMIDEKVPTVHIETLLKEAGYNVVNVQAGPVQAIDIVRSISGRIRPKKLSADYDEMRSESSLIRTIARNILLPPSALYAKYLSAKGYQGGNLYIKAVRDYPV